jgi:hypothetical protein
MKNLKERRVVPCMAENGSDPYLKLVTKWWRKMEASSLARSRPGHSLCPPPKGVKLLVLVSCSC